jgi:hypothetical protein
MRAPGAERGGQGPGLWVQGLACGAVATLATPSFMLGVCLLAPGLAVLLLDAGQGRPVARAVLTCGAAAALPSLAALWHGGATLEAALALAGDVQVLGRVWAAQAGGWLLAELAPVFIRLALDRCAISRAARLRMARARQEAEWGLPPRR